MTAPHRDLANAIRALSMDAVEAAQSGHPGMPMGMADIATVLFREYLRHNPANPEWPDRDRLIVSNGHGSMLPYAALHLSGYALPIEELKAFRQLHSKTAGHPEYGETPGIETTTGPLGQGLGNAVGMALAEKLLRARFGTEVVDHRTFVLTGDGCLMEGISHEVCSLAGTWRLGRLIALYDQNEISIDGRVEGWFTDNTPGRFRAYGWHVIEDVDGHHPDAVRRALDEALAQEERPSLICCRTVIGFGAPNKQGTAATHGAPLGSEEVAAARREIGWTHAPFVIPDEIYSAWDQRARGAELEEQWQQRFDSFRENAPGQAAEFERRRTQRPPEDFAERLTTAIAQAQDSANSMATRKASQAALDVMGPLLPELIGGSADLTGSNNTRWEGSIDVLEDPARGNYIYYGVREFGMTAIANGLALHGGYRPYVGTFLTFSDYARNAVRMAALIPARTILVYTHDSIGLGEDGPTHQPIEHLASLRLIPNLDVWRPCDAVESMVAWQQAVMRTEGPVALIFSRQTLEHQFRDRETVAQIEKGAYVLLESRPGQEVDVIIIATGSEVAIAMQAGRELQEQGVQARVVSMPCWEAFERQPVNYREGVLPSHCLRRVAVEAAQPDLWRKYVGLGGEVVGIDRFGLSAPAKDVFEHFGFHAQAVVAACRRQLGGR